MEKGIHKGVVIGNLMPNQLVMVKPDGKFEALPCIWAAGILSGLLGYKTSHLPSLKTRVLFLYTGEQVSYVLGSYSDTIPVVGLDRGLTDHNAPAVGDLQSHTTQRADNSRMAAGASPPIDLMEGELNLDNLMGVGVSLLRHLSSLEAGDLARVECHLLDDLVRIISKNFKHHSAFGDFKITNDGGKLGVEWQGTSLDHEAWGERNPRDQKAQLDQFGDNVDMAETADGYNDDGRWRFSQYVGWLGDFVNLFVTDPVNAIGQLAQDQFRAGKARVHINNDGAVLVQSVADIVLEKVVRIPVPIRIRREEDPQGNRSDDTVRNPDQLAQWKPSDSGNLFEMAFQLREYARWLNNLHSLSRFRQMSRDFQVPTESATPVPDLNSSEDDKQKVNGAVNNWRIAYSCIRIYRDGSIQTVDAYGNSFLSTKTGIQVSSTKDILLQAAGSVNIVAGRDINLLAQQNVGITAVQDTLRLKAKNGIWLLVEAGKFIVEFIQAGVAFFKNGTLNVNNVASVDVDGNTNVTGILSALQVEAASTMIADDHGGHIFPGFPFVVSLSDNFSFQSDYGGDQLYQTEAQASLTRNEQTSSSSWDFAGNVVAGKGSPWPGQGKQEKKTTGGQNLSQPSAATPGAAPAAMTSSSITMKVQT